MDVIGTTPGKEEVELRREQQPRVESGTETEERRTTAWMEEVERIRRQSRGPWYPPVG